MRDLFGQLLATLPTRPVAFCRVVETRGSTPQKAGAAMLVFADGSQAGTLGGGCVEAEVKRRALGILNEGDAALFTFNLDHDYGWDDGLICGGRMVILVDPLRDAQSVPYFDRLGELVQSGVGCTEAIVFDADKAALPVPATYLFDAQGNLVASARGAGAEVPPQVAQGLKPLDDRPRPYAARGIAYLPTLPRCRLVIVGAGHVGHAVGTLAADLDFDVWIVDDRADYANAERFPRAERVIVGPIDRVLPELDINENTYCLIVTRGHNHDQEALFHLAERGARYVGLIGSRRKIKMIFEDLLEAGISREALARVYAPLGIHIGSQTVMEIAISILAELVAHRNLHGQVPGRPAPLAEVETP